MEKRGNVKSITKSYRLIEKPGKLLRRKVRLSEKKTHPNCIRQADPESFSTTATPIKCSVCNLIFQSNSEWNLKRHSQLHKPIMEKYQCTVCLRTYSTKFNFEKHLPRRHQNENYSTIAWKITFEPTRVRPTFPNDI